MNADVCPPYALFAQAGNADGPDASRVKRQLDAVAESFSRSVFFTGNAQTAKAELLKLAAEGTKDDWDNAGGAAIGGNSLQLALKLLNRMPRNWPAPSVDLDNDGSVALGWYRGPGRRISVSIGNNGKLVYAWMIRTKDGKIERNYGVAESEGNFPETVSDMVSRLFD